MISTLEQQLFNLRTQLDALSLNSQEVEQRTEVNMSQVRMEAVKQLAGARREREAISEVSCWTCIKIYV